MSTEIGIKKENTRRTCFIMIFISFTSFHVKSLQLNKKRLLHLMQQSFSILSSFFIFLLTRVLPVFICSVIEREHEAAKSPEPPSEQNIHPRVSMVPSLLGQVMPASKDILYIFFPNRFFKYEFKSFIYIWHLL